MGTKGWLVFGFWVDIFGREVLKIGFWELGLLFASLGGGDGESRSTENSLEHSSLSSWVEYSEIWDGVEDLRGVAWRKRIFLAL